MLQCQLLAIPPCESKPVSRSSRKATVAKTDCGHIPSLVGDHSQMPRVLGWALTRIRNILLVLRCSIQRWLCVEQSRELFSDIRERNVGLAMLASTRE